MDLQLTTINHQLTSRKILIAVSCLFLMGMSFFFSLRKIDRPSLWLDEYWCLYLSTGRGDSVLNTPRGVILDAPPVWFDNAPPAWRIWNGLHSTIHPPFGYLVLRAWVDLFGDSDFSTRFSTATFSALSAVLLFWVVLRCHSIQAAYLAVAIMLLSVSQTDYAQMIRPYCLGNFLALCCIAILLHLREKRLTQLKLISLGFICLLMLLTHYYCFGPFVAFAIFVFLRFPIEKRIPILIAMALAAVVFAGTWLPFMPWSIGGIPSDMRYPGLAGLLYSFVQTPRQLLFGHFFDSGALMIFLAVTVFVLPIFQLRKSGEALLWWLWATIPLCVVAAVDLVTISKRAPTLSLARYELFALPGICAMVTQMNARFVRWMVPLAGIAALPILNLGTGWLIAHAPSSLMENSLMIVMALMVIGLLAVVLSRPKLSRWLSVHSKGGSGRFWLWFAGVLFFLMWFDFYSRLAMDPRVATYAIFVVYIILVFLTPADRRLASIAPCVLLFCLGCAAFNRFIQGPAPEPDWKTTTQIIQQSVSEGDLLIFDDPGMTGPNFEYILYQHYAHDDLSHKIMLIGKPTDMSGIRYAGNIWLISFDLPRDMKSNFPGWHIVREAKFADVANVLNIAPGAGGN